ncbi:amidohydrolase family protein [Paraburkholderia phymatum]|uniref:amidohydrolase family protein n=1 Tax=Paraburkholderia phymatum TaxID=148447 RepID=UPI003180D92F
MQTTLPYPVFDCDNHFYEPPEALLRHLPKEYEQLIQYVQVNGRTKLAIDGKISDYIPNPTFEVVAAPGCHVDYYRGNNPEGKSFREFNVVEKGIPEYAYKTPRRYEMLQEHGLVGAMVYPTLASVIEGHMGHNPAFCHAAIHSLNQWIKEEWGFGQDGKFYGMPVITMMKPDLALEEAQWIIDNGARTVLIRPTYVPDGHGSRSMGSPEFDSVWALLAKHQIFVTFHISDNGYNDVYARHRIGGRSEFLPFDKQDPLEIVMDVNATAVQHHLASLICHGVFDRHPTLKVGYVECGAYWLFPLIERMHHVYKMQPKMFKQDPLETIREHVYIHPNYEDDIKRLAELIGVENVLFGSDWPHPEGYAVPLDWLNDIEAFSETDKAKIMGGNIMRLLRLAA